MFLFCFAASFVSFTRQLAVMSAMMENIKA